MKKSRSDISGPFRPRRLGARPIPGLRDIWQMISRTAFTQLRYSAVLLALTLLALSVVWLAPAWAILFGHGWQRACGFLAFGSRRRELSAHVGPL